MSNRKQNQTLPLHSSRLTCLWRCALCVRPQTLLMAYQVSRKGSIARFLNVKVSSFSSPSNGI
jgi:hypothetical protein